MQKKIESTHLYKGKIFQITQDIVEIENGLHVTRDIIHHNGGVGVVAIQDNQLLMVRQFRYATHQDLFEIPAGKLEKNENPLLCGIRELEEETGYRCTEMIPITKFYSTPGFCNEMIHLYEAKNFKKVDNPLAMDIDECIHVEWIDLEKAYAMIHSGDIIDAKTIIAIQYAKLNKQS